MRTFAIIETAKDDDLPLVERLDRRIPGPVVTEHKFKIGQLVYFHPKGAGPVTPTPGQYRIIRRLPAGENGEFRYEIRNTLEEHDRILTRA